MANEEKTRTKKTQGGLTEQYEERKESSQYK